MLKRILIAALCLPLLALAQTYPSPQFQGLTVRGITGLLVGNGTSSVSAYAGASCTNQFPRSLSVSGAVTCNSVGLTTDVTGTLPVANGGTGTTTSTGTGSVVLSSAPALTGTVAITGAITATTTGVMPLYSTTGTGANAPHMVQGSVALSSGAATVTLSGAAVFSSSTSYICTANDATATNAVKVSNTSGTQFALAGTTTDTVAFVCVGN